MKINRKLIISTCGLAIISCFGLSAPVQAATSNAPDNRSRSSDTLPEIVNKADQRIAKRQNDLAVLKRKILTTSKLTPANRAALLSDIAAAKTGLETLQVTIHINTATKNALSDSNRMGTDFRIYALLIPKVNLIKISDNQFVQQEKLRTAISLLTPVAIAAPNKPVLVAKLVAARSKLDSAQKLSEQAQAQLLTLTPTAPSADHSLLTSARATLSAAHTTYKSAYADVKYVQLALKATKD